MTQATEIAVGEFLALSSGEYSDYRIGCFSRVLKPITKAVWGQMVEACTEPLNYAPEEQSFNESKVAPWLVANGYIEEIPYHELHLGDYGDKPSWESA
jgi:hypothetical protein